jgi:hypothetical protein
MPARTLLSPGATQAHQTARQEKPMKNHAIVLSVLAALAIVGCHKKPKHEKGPMESAGEEVDEAGRKAKQDTDEAVEEAGDKAQEAGDKIEDKTD